MDKDKIMMLGNVVLTMEDEDKIDFLNKYRDDISIKAYSSIAVSMEKQEYLVKYVKYAFEDIYNFIISWEDGDEKVYKNFGIDTIEEILNDIMFAISKVSNEDKINLISTLLKDIMPSIRFFCGDEKFYEKYEMFFCIKLYKIVNSLSDCEIQKLFSDVENILFAMEPFAFFGAIKEEKGQEKFIKNESIPDEFRAIVCNNSNNQEIIKMYLKDCLERLDSHLFESDNNVCQDLIDKMVLASENIQNDDLLEEIINYVYDNKGYVLLELFKFIRDDDRKIALLNDYGIELRYDNYDCVDIVSSISDENKFLNVYGEIENNSVELFNANDFDKNTSSNNLTMVEELFNALGINSNSANDFDDSADSAIDAKIDLIINRKDEQLALEMLEDCYNKFEARDFLQDYEFNLNLLEQVSKLMGIIDLNSQLLIYNMFAEFITDEEKSFIILPIKDNNFKRNYIKMIEEKELNSINELVLKNKLYI